MTSRILIALGFAAISAAATAQTTETATPAEKTAGDTVIATVNGEEITIGDIVAMRAELPPQYQSIPDLQLYQGLTEQLANQILLRQAAERVGLADRESVKRGLKLQRISYLAELYARERIDVELTKETIEAEYERRYAAVEAQKEWNASHILVPEEETAKEIAELARAEGADFAKLAMERSTGPSGPTGGSLGWFSAGQMVPEFQAGVEALEPGGVSDPVQSQFGWHVIKLNEARDKPIPALTDVIQDLVGEMSRQVTDAMADALREEATIEFVEGQPGLDRLRDDTAVEE